VIRGFCLGKNRFRYRDHFADMLHRHLATRPNLRTAGGVAHSPWLFPGVRPGRHLTAQTIMKRLRDLGINLLGARNTALQSLAVEVPPPLVADLLGYSYNVTQRRAEIAGYVTSRQARRRQGPWVVTDAVNDSREAQ
jgi:hypothetical protein